MKNNTSPVARIGESAKANDNKGTEKAKLLADEDAHNLVGLYALSDKGVWDVRGTGHVDCVQFRDRLDAWWIVVWPDSNEKNVLVSRILRDTIYQKQRETTIVWSKTGVSKLALIFQEKSGCKKIWDKLCQIQGKDSDVELDSIVAINETLKQQLKESKTEVDAAQIRVNDLDESNSQLREKLENSEVQLQQSSERNRKLTAELHTLDGKNRETLQRNCELEQELSNSQGKIRDLEAKFDEVDVSQLIKLLEEKSEILKNCQVSRLQDSIATKNNELVNERKLRLSIGEKLEMKDAEAAKLSDENDMIKQELIDLQLRFDESEKQNEAEQKRWQNLANQMTIETDSLREQIRKKNAKAVKLACENANIKWKVLDIQKGIVAAEKQNAETIKEKEKMEEQLAEWQRYHQKIGEAAKFGDGISKEKPTNSQSLQQQSAPILSPPAWIRHWQESMTKSDIEMKKNLKEAGAKKAANMA